MNLSINELRRAYVTGDLVPKKVVDHILQSFEQWREHNIWITPLSAKQIQLYLDDLANKSPQTHALYGIPFAIKDNIDLANVRTTAACEAFAYHADEHAFVVARLIDAGAIPIGKTNMDQFATGLVGTRSPWGACKNVFNEDYISGGSSSGSAVAVAAGLVSFALGTDTAGSGRVPAAFNNIVGLKPSKGIVSTRGVVPACRSLDCVSIFALNTDDAQQVLRVATVFDEQDDYARKNPFKNNFRHYRSIDKQAFVFAHLNDEQLAFFGNNEYRQLYAQACQDLTTLGGSGREIDFQPFLQAARLLYDGPWVAERYVAIEALLEKDENACLAVIDKIITGSKSQTAVDTFKAFYQLQSYHNQVHALLSEVDFMLTPTAPTHYRQAEIEADPIELNSNLGYYTNYMNLLDCCGLSLPAGFTQGNLPFGVSMIAPAFNDQKLLSFGRLWQIHKGIGQGATADKFHPREIPMASQTQEFVDLVVCGAHLSGLPLNWQLTERGAKLMTVTQSAPYYRLYDLGGTIRRPAMVRADRGESIVVEVWRLAETEFGGFVAQIPPPLGIGKVELADGRWLSGFICETQGVAEAKEITEFAGWVNYLASLKTI